MPQVLKTEIRSRIRESALRLFAEQGYVNATMAEVAARARVATANVYRYYRSKDELFHDVVSGDVVDELERLVGLRLGDFAALVDRDGTTADVAEEMMQFWLRHRLESVVILAGSTGTSHADVVPRLTRLSVQSLVDALPPGAVRDGDRNLLEAIWANTPRTLARILLHNESDLALRSAITSFWQYQVAGLTALLRHLAHRPQ